MCMIGMVIAEELGCVCVRACVLVRIFRASRVCMSKYVEQSVPDAGHTHTHTRKTALMSQRFSVNI